VDPVAATVDDLDATWLSAALGTDVASVLTGVTTAEQVVANAAAADWDLSPEEVAAVAAIVAAEGGPASD